MFLIVLGLLKIGALLKNPRVIFYMFCNNFFYTLLPYISYLQKGFYSVQNDTNTFFLFLLQTDFVIFHEPSFIFCFFFYRKILIPLASLFLKPLFVFLIVSGWHFYICEKNISLTFHTQKTTENSWNDFSHLNQQPSQSVLDKSCKFYELFKITCNHLKILKNRFSCFKCSIFYDWLIDHTPKLIRKSVGSFTGKVVSLFKTNTPKDYCEQTPYSRGNKPTKPKWQN